MANTADTAHLDRWGRPAWAGRPSDRFDGRYGGGYPAWHPARILLIVAGFIIWWPIGLATRRCPRSTGAFHPPF